MNQGYIHSVSWPPGPNPSPNPTGNTCHGILYTIIRTPGSGKKLPNDTNICMATLTEDMQSLYSHFWSTIIQTPFLHCPIAIVTEHLDKATIPLLPMILKIHHFDLIRYIDYFENESTAQHWLKTKHAQWTSEGKIKTCVTFSSIQ